MDFFEILKNNGIEVPEEKRESLRKEVFQNMKTVEEFDKKVKKLETDLKTANDTITDLKDKVGDTEALNKRIEEYEQADKDRAAAEEKAAATKKLRSRFDTLKGDRTYINEGTESWMFSEFEKALADEKNAGKSDSELYEAITKDKNIFTPSNEKFTNPPAGDSQGEGDKPKFKSFF